MNTKQEKAKDKRGNGRMEKNKWANQGVSALGGQRRVPPSRTNQEGFGSPIKKPGNKSDTKKKKGDYT